MSSVEVINLIAPDYFKRFRFNTTKEETLRVLCAENTLAEEAVADAISKMDLLVMKCYELLKFAVQAQMSTISTAEDKAEPNLDQVIERTIEGINQESKDHIKRYANWLIAKG